MSIQEDILDTIGEGGISVAAMRSALADEQGLSAESGQHHNPVEGRSIPANNSVDAGAASAENTRPINGSGSDTQLTISPIHSASLSAAALSPDLDARRVNAPLGTTSKPALTAPQGKTGESPAPDSVLERVGARRQAALNRLALLEVERENLRGEVRDCERFVELWERFEGVSQ